MRQPLPRLYLETPINGLTETYPSFRSHWPIRLSSCTPCRVTEIIVHILYLIQHGSGNVIRGCRQCRDGRVRDAGDLVAVRVRFNSRVPLPSSSYLNRRLPTRSPLSPGELRHLEATGMLLFAEKIIAPQVIPRKPKTTSQTRKNTGRQSEIPQSKNSFRPTLYRRMRFEPPLNKNLSTLICSCRQSFESLHTPPQVS